MAYDEGKVDEVVLALMHLNVWQDKFGWRTWKGFDWDTLDRLHAQGYIGEPKSKSRSVTLTDAGLERAAELFERHFGPADR